MCLRRRAKGFALASFFAPGNCKRVEELGELVFAKICVQYNSFFQDLPVARVDRLYRGGDVLGPDCGERALPVAEEKEGEELCTEDTPRSLLVKALDDLLEGKEIGRLLDQRGEDSTRRTFQHRSEEASGSACGVRV